MLPWFTEGVAPNLRQNAIQIALDYLRRTGEIDDYAETLQFLVNNIDFMINEGQRNKLVLANRAISAYERHRKGRTVELCRIS
jgi:hypothetical protein